MKTILAIILLAATAQAATLDLKWNDNSDNEDGFLLERSTNGAEFVEIGGVGSNVTTFTDEDVPLNSTVSYRCYAVNRYGDSPFSNTVVEITKPPKAPTDLKENKGNGVAKKKNKKTNKHDA